MIKVIDGIIYVNGEATTDPQLIGLAMLDAAEEGNIKISFCDQKKRKVIIPEKNIVKPGKFHNGKISKK
jgi:hypothetical protein